MKHRHKLTTILLGSLALSCAASHAQLKTGSNPATLTANTNLEVEATNGKKLLLNKADGTLTYQHTTQGDGKVLTSDISGVATWQTPVTGTIVKAVSENGSYDQGWDQLIEFTSPTDPPVYLNWKINLTPGRWFVTIRPAEGILQNASNLLDYCLELNGSQIYLTLGGGGLAGKIYDEPRTTVIDVTTAGTYRLIARPHTSYVFKGYVGLDLNHQLADGTPWATKPEFPGADVFYHVFSADQGNLFAIKLK